MRKSVWIRAVVPAVLTLAATSSAYAFQTCKQVPTMCPANISEPDRPRSSVPEPATLALSASGLGALGFSVYRRRNKR